MRVPLPQRERENGRVPDPPVLIVDALPPRGDRLPFVKSQPLVVSLSNHGPTADKRAHGEITKAEG